MWGKCLDQSFLTLLSFKSGNKCDDDEKCKKDQKGKCISVLDKDSDKNDDNSIKGFKCMCEPGYAYNVTTEGCTGKFLYL